MTDNTEHKEELREKLEALYHKGANSVLIDWERDDPKPLIDEIINDFTVAKARNDIAEEMGKMLEIQGANGTWNYDPYMHGLYNGMEFCHALVKDVEPKYREAPNKWLADIPMPKNARTTQLKSQEDK